MALAYTAPTWTDGSGEGISASNLQAISDCIEGLVQGSDKAVHAITIDASGLTVVYADGTQETAAISDYKGIASIVKTATAGLVDTYTITYTDGTTSTFEITNGSPGTSPTITATAQADALSSLTPTVVVTKTGTDDAPNFDFAFSGLKGPQGDPGEQGEEGPAGRDGAIQYTAGNGISIASNTITADVQSVAVAGSGTASASVTHQQQVTVNGVSVDIDGTKYMESTANSASFVFSNAAIIATSAIDVYTDTWGDNPSASGGVVASAGSCTVTFDTAQTRTVRIYIK